MNEELLIEGPRLSQMGAVLELRHADGSRAFLPLRDLVDAPATLRIIWGSVAGVRDPAEMAERLIAGAGMASGERENMTEEQVDWASDGAAAEAARERRERRERVDEANAPKPDAVQQMVTEEERKAAIKRQERNWLTYISPGRRRAAAAEAERRKPLDIHLLCLFQEREEAAKQAAVRAADECRAAYDRRVQAVRKAFEKGDPYWREAGL